MNNLYQVLRTIILTRASKVSHRYQPLIKFYIKELLKNSSTLDIAINNMHTLLLEFAKLNDYDENKSNKYTYISTKLYYAILQERRKHKMDKLKYSEVEVDTIQSENDIEGEIDAQDLRKRIEEYIDPEIVKMLVEGYSSEEIAEAKGISVKQFYNYMEYRKKLLKGVLNAS